MTHATPHRIFPLALGAVLLGSVGCAALAFSGGGPEELDPQKLALEQEVARLHAKLGESGTQLKRSRRRVGDLERRLADFGVRLASRDEKRGQRAGGADVPAGEQPTPVSPVNAATADAVVRGAVLAADGLKVELAQPGFVAGRYQLAVAGGLNGANGVNGPLNGNWTYSTNFTRVIADHRFTEAQKALELDTYQVSELRRMVAERDAAYSNAGYARVEDDGKGARVVNDVDAYALARADEVFQSSVDGLLTEKQRKAWADGKWPARFGGKPPQVRPQANAALGIHTIRLATVDTVDAKPVVVNRAQVEEAENPFE